MQIGKKMFPYPVLNNSKNVSSFVNSSYQLDYEPVEDNESFTLKNARITVNNENLRNFIRDGKAAAVLVVECGYTIFKNHYDIFQDPKDIVIPIRELKGQVEVSSFIYAKEDIKEYTDNDLLEDYDGFKFNIDKYDILAIDDGFTETVEYEESDDKKRTSFFTVIRKADANFKSMQVSVDDTIITIMLPSKEFDYFDRLQQKFNYRNVLWGMIVVPSLVLVFDNIKTNFSDISELLQQYQWFASVMQRYEKATGEKLTWEKFNEISSLEIAQLLLNNCSNQGIIDFTEIADTQHSEMEDLDDEY